MTPHALLPDVARMLRRCGALTLDEAAAVLRVGVRPFEVDQDTAVDALRLAVALGKAQAERRPDGRWQVRAIERRPQDGR